MRYIIFVLTSSNTCRFTSKYTNEMGKIKEKDANHVETPSEKVEIPNRLKALGLRFPTMKPIFKQFFRDNGVGDLIYYNLETGRQKLSTVYDRIIDRMVKHFNIKE